MSETWDLWQDDAHSPAMNMALDEALMMTAESRKRPLLRLYGWDREAVSIGYVQRLAKVPKDKGEIVRRPTGGGIVFHKHHFTYTVVLPNDHWIVDGTQPVESYNWLNKGVQSGLDLLEFESQLAQEDIPKSVDRAGMVCFVTPTKYDLLSDEKKIAGSAQRRAREGMLHQGSIEMEGVSNFTKEKLREVLPIGFSKVLNCEYELFTPSGSLIKLAKTFVQEKYGTEAWNGKR
jgi:lipoate-protein ligase A